MVMRNKENQFEMWCYRTVAGWIENVMNKDVLENIMGKKPLKIVQKRQVLLTSTLHASFVNFAYAHLQS